MNEMDLDLVIGALATTAIMQYERTHREGWREEEDAFIRRYLGWLSEEEIGQAIGRTASAVRVHWKRELKLVPPSKSPDLITANRAAEALGLSSCHAVASWVDMGFLPGRMMAGSRNIRLIPRVSFMRWAVTPANWIYFRIDRVRDPHLKRLIDLRRERWGDEWWTLRQAANYLGVDIDAVQLASKHGRLKTVQPQYSIGGRNLTQSWRLKFVLRSEAMRPDLKFPTRKGNYKRTFTPRAQAWILHAHEDLGMIYEEICRSMKLDFNKPSELGRYVRRNMEEQNE